MPIKRRSSKRTVKIPIKFGDTVCDLNTNKHNRDRNEDEGNEEVTRDGSDDVRNGGNDDGLGNGDGDTESEAILGIGIDFPPLNATFNNVTVSEQLNKQNFVFDHSHDANTRVVDHNGIKSMNVNDCASTDSDSASKNDDETSVDCLNNKQTIGVSYVTITTAKLFDNKLELIPTITNKENREVVVFDDELIELCSNKW
ncbi:hypothetical protein Tco_0389843 [Tanacetum coccineum]